MSVVAVGSIALDAVETPFGKREDALGGSATFFSFAASFFTPVQLVAVVGEDFPAEHVQLLASRGIDLAGLSRVPGRTFRWAGRYGANLNEAQTLDTQLNVFEHFEPQLPASFRASPFVFLGNIEPTLQAKVLDQVERPMLVAADTMNFWIQGRREALLETLARVNLLFVNDAEARLLAGETNIVRAARAIQAMGPQWLVIKRGEYGALLFAGDRIFAAPAFPLADIVDPTGAGDSFAGGFMGSLARIFMADPKASRETVLSDRNLRQALVMGNVLASFQVEGFSVDRMRDVREAEVFERYAAFQRLTEFESYALGTLRA